MTAINVVRTPHSVVVAVDSASYDPDDGTVIAFTSKSWPVPHWPGCVSTRGEALALPLLAFTLGNQFRDFDDLVARIGEEIEDVHDRILPFLEYPEMPIDLVLAGWSQQRRRPESFYMRMGSEEVLGMSDSEVTAAIAAGSIAPDAYKLTELPRRAYGPNVTGLGNVGTDTMSESELAAFMRQVLEKQRADLFDPGDGNKFSIVGGFASMTVVTADGITQKIIHRWDDKVGERIDSGSSLASQEPEAPKLSKLREQMAQRKARKLARHG